jgi:transcriptional regulator with XRE-family HTH domain
MTDDEDERFSPELVAFGERLRALRMRTGMKQREVAEILQLRVPTISDWEMAVSEPKFFRVVKLAELYGVSLNVIAGIEPLPPATRRPTGRRMPE